MAREVVTPGIVDRQRNTLAIVLEDLAPGLLLTPDLLVRSEPKRPERLRAVGAVSADHDQRQGITEALDKLQEVPARALRLTHREANAQPIERRAGGIRPGPDERLDYVFVREGRIEPQPRREAGADGSG